MADAVVTIQDDELKALCSRLNAAALSPGDKQKLLDSVGEEMEVQTKLRLDSAPPKKGSDDKPWDDIRASTRDYYRKHGIDDSPAKLMFRSGSLLDSISHEVDGLSVLVGACKAYAAIHQWGGSVYPFGNRKAKKVKISPRPYLGLSADDKIEVVELIEGFISERL